MEKRCYLCKQIKDESEFNKCKREKDGLQGCCRKCQSESGKKYKIRLFLERTPRSKICRICGVEKKLEYFRPCKGRLGNLSNTCIECENNTEKQKELVRKRAREYKAKNKIHPTFTERRLEKELAEELIYPNQKQCRKCHEWKDVSEFGKNRYNKKEIHRYCKKCSSDMACEWSKNNKEYINEKRRKWVRENPEIAHNRNKERYWANRDEKLKANSEWYKTDKGLEFARRNTETRRAKMLNQSSPVLTKTEWDCILESFNHRCAYCKKPEKRLAQDHFVPVAKGGEYTFGNIVPCCKSCNSTKHDKWPEQWIVSEYGKDRYAEILAILERIQIPRRMGA